MSETSKIWVVDNEGSEISNSAHNSRDHSPCQLRAVGSVWLLHNRSDTMSPDDCPDEERDSGSRDDESLDCEQMSDLVDWEPDGGQRAKPEDEERDKVSSVGSRVGDTVVKVGE